MKPINLFLLTRTSDFDLDLYIDVEKVMSLKNEDVVIREHEKNDLKKMVDSLFCNANDLEIFDKFYYSYTIPQISEEFDLLKFNEQFILNIEIKDVMIAEQEIINQLEKNRYYLSHLEKKIISLTYITEDNKFLIYNNNNLQEIEIREVIEILKHFTNDYEVNIDELFKASMFLVSPLNSPQKFLNNNYFLTNHQYEIKLKIKELIRNPNYNNFQIKGIAGTGKTLLLYDLAKELTQYGKVCIIHAGILCNGHTQISEKSNIDIISAKSAKDYDLSQYNYILIDESHRIYKNLFEKLSHLNRKLIFSLDNNQILSKAERNRNIPGLIIGLPNLQSFELTKKIRTNKELAAFIVRMFDLGKRNPNINFKNVDLFYANNIDECKTIIRYLKNKNYYFINYTPSRYNMDKLDHMKILANSNTHKVIGQEFDNVLMYIDQNFYYENNILKTYSHPNPDYLYDKLLFQGITRVREKIAIVVLENIDVYAKLLKIIINKE